MAKKATKKRIPIGVVGLGRIGWGFHCKAIDKSRDFELVAVCDPQAERRAEAEATYGCKAFADPAAMFRDGGIEAVTIATPQHLHKAHAQAAFRARLHVLLEKPMAMGASEAKAILRAAKGANRVLTVYQPHRASAYLRHAIKVIESGKLGEVYQVRIGRFGWVRRNDWQSLTKYGGGMLNNYGAHALDAALAITGFNYSNVFCCMRRIAAVGDAEDAVKVTWRTKEGVLGDVEINYGVPANPFFLEVYGSLGSLTGSRQEMRIKYVTPSQMKPKAVVAELAASGRQYPSDQVKFREKTIPVSPRQGVDYYKNFAAAIRGEGALLVPPEQSVALMTMMDECRRQAGEIIDSTWKSEK